MIDEYIAELGTGVPNLLTNQLETFLQTVGSGKTNGKEFAQLITSVVQDVDTDFRYVRSGDHNTSCRAREAVSKNEHERLGLNPDFITSRTRYDSSTDEYSPLSFSSILQPPKDTTGCPPRRSVRLSKGKDHSGGP
jgi:hypothetical protein